MFNHLHYVPILRSKRAEFAALLQLSNDTKDRLTPMIEVIPVPWDHSASSPKKTLKAHLDAQVKYIVKYWPADHPMFLDLMYVASNNETVDGKHALVYCIESLLSHGQSIIPVTGLDGGQNYQNAINTILKKNKMGLCFRIQRDDLDDFDQLSVSMDALLKDSGIDRQQCDIILDFQALPIPGIGDSATYISNIIRFFPNLANWRTFTIAASNFPKILELNPDSNGFITREEYLIWRDIITRNEIPRLPSFGDYAIQHPDMSDLDFRKIKSSVNLRYATENQWLVYKGREKNRYGYGQFNSLCNQLVKRSEYSGSDFSAGDYYIDCCAKDTAGPGSGETWRKVGFNHHMTFIAQQLASFDAS